MMSVIAIFVFVGALGLSLFALAVSVLPNITRIADALAGRVRSPAINTMPVERRYGVKRRVTISRPGAAVRAAA